MTKFKKVHEEVKKGMKLHMEYERILHEAQIQEIKDKKKKLERR